MKIPPEKIKKETEEYVYKYCYKKWVKVGKLKEQQYEKTSINNKKK